MLPGYHPYQVREYADDDRSMVALVFAPCTPEAGVDRNRL